MKILLLSAALLISSLLLFSCKKDNPIPPEDQPQINLTLEDTSCTEVWLKLSTANISLPADVFLKQDDSLVQTINLNGPDTLLYVDSLLPNHTYSFKSSVSSSQPSIESNEINIRTLDTTSHNFTWQAYTFGGTAGSSTLYDVAIIDENNIWAVGAIYVADTSQNGYTLYNAVHWNGSQWELKRVYFPTVCGSTSQTSYPASAIFAFDNGEIWISSSGDKVAILRNGLQINKFCMPWSFSINKIWGNSSKDLYVVGNNGNIVHYQNGQWSRIESGTDLNIGDIWGIPDNNGGYNKYLAADNSLLIINDGNDLQSVNTESGHSLSSIWGRTVRLIYTAGGNGVSLYKNFKWEKVYRADVNTIYFIRGSDFNNVFGLSSTYSMLHFNGYTWQYVIPVTNNIYLRTDVKTNTIAAVGWQGEKAVVTFIKRNK